MSPPDVNFAKYAFPATGATGRNVNRTMPDRLGLDIVNVKEFGAVGDGVTDDGPAFIAAIKYAYSLHGSPNQGTTVYLPAGVYFIASSHFPIQLGSSNGQGTLRLTGAARDSTVVKGSADGIMFIKSTGSGSLQSICDLTIWNQSQVSSSICYRAYGAENAPLFENCHFIGPCGIDLQENAFGETVSNCIFTCGIPIGRADSIAAAAAAAAAGTIGMTFDQGHVRNCRFEGFACGLALGSTATGILSIAVGQMVSGCYFSRCNTGITGLASLGASGMVGTTIIGNQFDRCNWAMYLNIIANSSIISNRVSGLDGLGGPADPVPIQSMTLSGGTVTVTTSVAHNIGADQALQLIAIKPSGFVPPGNTTGLVSIHVTGATTFTYPNAGPNPGAFVSGSWNYPMQYAITIGASSYVLYAANILDAIVSRVSFDVNNQGNGPRDQSICDCWSMQAPFGWNHAPNGYGYQTYQWRFLSCDMTGGGIPPIAWMQYRDLGANSEGEEWTIVDAQTQNTFGGVVSGGGSANHYKVRWNGANWIRVG